MQLFNEQRERLELDNFNLLYVALTRAVEQLYIITEYKVNRSRRRKHQFLFGIFIRIILKEQHYWKKEFLNTVLANKKMKYQNVKR